MNLLVKLQFHLSPSPEKALTHTAVLAEQSGGWDPNWHNQSHLTAPVQWRHHSLGESVAGTGGSILVLLAELETPPGSVRVDAAIGQQYGRIWFPTLCPLSVTAAICSVNPGPSVSTQYLAHNNLHNARCPRGTHIVHIILIYTYVLCCTVLYCTVM